MAGRIIRLTGLLALAAALSAPVAAAQRLDEQGSVSTSPSTVVVPNDPIGMGGQLGLRLIHEASTGSSSAVAAQRARDTALNSIYQPVVAQFYRDSALNAMYQQHANGGSATVSTGNDGFNWGAAGIGAAGFAAFALAIGLLTVLTRRGRDADVAVS